MTDSQKPLGDRLAFPFACQGPTTGPEFYYGMTIRQYAAIQIAAGASADPNVGGHEALASWAVRMADQLIRELEKTA